MLINLLFLFSTNIIANVRHALLFECAVRAMLKNLNEVMMVAIVVARNSNEARVAPIAGSGDVCIWREFGVRLFWCV